MPNSLSLRVLLAYVVGVILSIALMILVTLVLTTYRSDLWLKADMAEYTRDLVGAVRFDARGVPDGLAASEEGDMWIYESLKEETAYRVLDDSGRPVLVSAAGEGFWSPVESRGLVPGSFNFERGGVRMHSAIERFEHGGRTWYLQFAVSTRMLGFIYQEFTLPFMGAGVVMFSALLLIVFGICAYVTLEYTLRPLRKLSESAASISPRALHARLRTEAVPSEIAPLVHSFNRALDRLEHGYRVQQEFLATAAHELKTPLSLIRAQVELREEGEDRDALLGDVEHMTRQVQQLLLLAEASEVQNYAFATTDVQEVARDAVAYLQRMAEAADVHVTLSGASVARWQADRGALFTLLKNLLENAIEHAPRGTEVRVEVDAETVTVRDSGPGVDPQDLSQMFSRFWRGAHRRDQGAGLGLAICREIAQAHGWALSAHKADPGLLLRLSVRTGSSDLAE
ncbi:ATP-binding protein [Luteimonas sp. RD2P54]|uniref:histidine kinase n=1 Tax=Luteimonas endophytica TaxID=3042023 RepID=A0ABT6J6P3_9GAMM|nr:ATP-binding protein [Luteimonas endophytica]MDH5822506.1 ATP-binding protein [Luteimonas endophytica]